MQPLPLKLTERNKNSPPINPETVDEYDEGVGRKRFIPRIDAESGNKTQRS